MISRLYYYIIIWKTILEDFENASPKYSNFLAKSKCDRKAGPHEFLGYGKNGYLCSGSWGAHVIIFRDLWSKLIVLGT